MLFSGAPPQVEGAPVGREALAGRLSAGGYPEARVRNEARRARWFDGYLESTLDRDLADISDAHKLKEMPRLLRLLASQAANIVAPARNRELRHPKVYVVDTGLLLHLLGADEQRLAEDDQITGKAMENFVAMEILRHAEWSEKAPLPFHYRQGRDEIDVVREDRAGNVAAVEVKASATIRARDWRPLERLRDAKGGADQRPVGADPGAVKLTVRGRPPGGAGSRSGRP